MMEVGALHDCGDSNIIIGKKPADSQLLLSQGKPVLASDDSDLRKDNLVDGTDSEWWTAQENVWIKINLLRLCRIQSVKIKWWGVSVSSKFVVSTSLNGRAYIPKLTEESASQHPQQEFNGWTILPEIDGEAQFLKLQLEKGRLDPWGMGKYFGIRSLEIYGEYCAPYTTAPDTILLGCAVQFLNFGKAYNKQLRSFCVDDNSSTMKVMETVSRKYGQLLSSQTHSVKENLAECGQPLGPAAMDFSGPRSNVAEGGEEATEAGAARAVTVSEISLATVNGGIKSVDSSASSICTLAATTIESGECWVWFGHAPAPCKVMSTHGGPCRACVLSADGAVAFLAAGATIQLWFSVTAEKITSEGSPVILDFHSSLVSCCSTSLDGKHLAVGTLDGKVSLWPLAPCGPQCASEHRMVLLDEGEGEDEALWFCGRCHEDQQGARWGCRSCIANICFTCHSLDGTRLVGAPTFLTSLHNPNRAHHGRCLSCSFSQDSSFLLSTGGDNFACLWLPPDGAEDPLTLPETLTLEAHPHTLVKVASVYEGNYGCDMCGEGGDGWVYHCKECGYDVHPRCAGATRAPSLVSLFRGHGAPVTGGHVSPNNRFVCTVSDDKTARVWQLNGTPLSELRLSSSPLACAFSHDCDTVFVATRDVGVIAVGLELSTSGAVRAGEMMRGIDGVTVFEGGTSVWTQEHALMIAIAGGGGNLDASLTADGSNGRSSNGEERVGTAGTDGGGGQGGHGQQGLGGSGWKSPSSGWESKSCTDWSLCPPQALGSLLPGAYFGAYRYADDRPYHGGLGGGGTSWYASSGGGGYSGGGGAIDCYGRGGGGGSYVEVGVDGLSETAAREASNIGTGYATLTLPSGEQISFHGAAGIRLPDRHLVECHGLSLEPSGVQVYKVEKIGSHDLVLAGAGMTGKGAVLQLRLEGLKVGDTIGVFVGQCSAYEDTAEIRSDGGGGATIAWLGRSDIDLFIASLTPSRAALALENIDRFDIDDVVCDALLAFDPMANEMKWTTLVCSSLSTSVALVDRLAEKNARRLKVAFFSAEVLVAALVPERVEAAARLLARGSVISEDVCAALLVQRSHLPPNDKISSALELLVRDDRCDALILTLVEAQKKALGPAALLFACHPSAYMLGSTLIDIDVEVSEVVVGGLLLNSSRLWNAILDVSDDGCWNFCRKLIARAPETLGSEAIVFFVTKILATKRSHEPHSVKSKGGPCVKCGIVSKTCLLLCKRITQVWAQHSEVQISDALISKLTCPLDESTLWHELVQVSECSDFVYDVVLTHTHLADKILDPSGRRAIDIASASNRQSINAVLLWHGRFRLLDQRPEHESATCFVFKAVDEQQLDSSGKPVKVALKLMRVKAQFVREISCREHGFSDDHVIGIITTFPSIESIHFKEHLQTMPDSIDFNLAAGQHTLNKSEAERLYCIVFPLADRNMFVALKQERFAGQRWDEIAHIFRQLVQSVAHLHSKGILHADLKPLNLLRVDTTWKLVDLDASCLIGVDFVGHKSSSAYMPPEAIFVDFLKKIAAVKSPQHKADAAMEYDLLLAHPSFDVWSLGCILYQMGTDAQPLFAAGQDDNLKDSIDADESLWSLFDWSDEMKDRKLRRVGHPALRNLISQMLAKDPSRRPTLARVLQHTFLTGKPVVRMAGDEPEYDVFISYRVWSDASHVEVLYEQMTQRGLKVWWDRECLLDGENWEAGFCKGLVNSRNFVCVLSRKALSNFNNLTPSSPCDNVLLEHRLALELHEMGMLEHIFPVIMGEPRSEESGQVGQYTIDWKCIWPNAPDTAVDAVELGLQMHLADQTLGTPLRPGRSALSVLTEIKKMQGALIDGGSYHDKMKEAVERVVKVSSKRPSEILSTADSGGGQLVDIPNVMFLKGEMLLQEIKYRAQEVELAALRTKVADLTSQLTQKP